MSLLITGSTGFLGKNVLYVLNELKYSKDIYLLIRDKRGKTSKQRFEELRLIFLNINLYLIETDILHLRKLTLPVDIMINCAASVDFDLKLKDAVEQNVDTVIEVLKYVKQNNIKRVIHVSTAYVSAPGKKIKEKFVNMHILGNINKLYTKIKNNEITFDEIITLKWFPNTYCFTKCLAEKMIEQEIKNNDSTTLFSIIRPSIITNSIKTPYLGWFQGYNGAIGFHKLMQMKLLKTLICNEHTKVDYVPVDYVSNIIIDSMTDTNSIIKHATSFFELPTIQNLTQHIQKKVSLYHNHNLHTFYSSICIHIVLIMYMTYYYLLSFFDDVYTKKYKKQYKLISIISGIQQKFHHFLHTTYVFHKANQSSNHFLPDVTVNKYYKEIFEKI